jgi:hypothetical protein
MRVKKIGVKYVGGGDTRLPQARGLLDGCRARVKPDVVEDRLFDDHLTSLPDHL